MNRVILSGNICQDIELKNTATGKPYINNTVAVKSDYKNANGDYDTTFINIVVWNKTAEFLNNYASKGTKVLVEGRLSTRSYEKQDGTKAHITEVVVDKVELLGAKKGTNKENFTVEEPKEEDPFATFSEQVSIDDDNWLD